MIPHTHFQFNDNIWLLITTVYSNDSYLDSYSTGDFHSVLKSDDKNSSGPTVHPRF